LKKATRHSVGIADDSKILLLKDVLHFNTKHVQKYDAESVNNMLQKCAAYTVSGIHAYVTYMPQKE